MTDTVKHKGEILASPAVERQIQRLEKMPPVTVKHGTILTLRAVRWVEPHWEFGCSTVVYSPLLRIDENGGSIESLVEDICIDLSIDTKASVVDSGRYWRWRNWSITNMPRRKKATHAIWRARFYENSVGELEFVLSKGEVQP